MKLIIKEKKIYEQEDQDDLSSYKFSKDDLDNRVEDLDIRMHKIAVPLQEKVPLQVAEHYFQIFGTTLEKSKISKFVDNNGLVKIADIFIIAKLQNNINLDWHLDKYNKE